MSNYAKLLRALVFSRLQVLPAPTTARLLQGSIKSLSDVEVPLLEIYAALDELEVLGAADFEWTEATPQRGMRRGQTWQLSEMLRESGYYLGPGLDGSQLPSVTVEEVNATLRVYDKLFEHCAAPDFRIETESRSRSDD